MNIDKIEITFIPYKDQRYVTVGDWYYQDKVLYIKVSDTKNRFYNGLIAIHELVEALLCDMYQVTQEQVDQFDLNFKGDGEPGDSLEAPYHKQHQFAEIIEHLVCREMFIEWEQYIGVIKMEDKNG